MLKLSTESIVESDFEYLTIQFGTRVYKLLYEFAPHVLAFKMTTHVTLSRMRFDAFCELLHTRASIDFAVMWLRKVVGRDVAQIIGKKIWDSRCDKEWEFN